MTITLALLLVGGIFALVLGDEYFKKERKEAEARESEYERQRRLLGYSGTNANHDEGALDLLILLPILYVIWHFVAKFW